MCATSRTVRDGNPPQTNIVHVDGNRSVLMMVLKAGATSTLDIIAGIKQKVIDVKDQLPDALKIGFIGDQSVFVRGAIQGVAIEGVIAALLTSVMILLFLGSWRSTVIIAVSIPLSVLGAIIMLSAIGETLNIMTLGGLALAVGILVDDATVTIENINYHLEQGKPVEQSILDGANQIVTPAFVSLLCICIVFVPMFFLTGVARFLFVPMAEAVMFAMIWSFILSRTLVPTMANYLLQPHVHHEGGPPKSRNPLVWFQRGFEKRFERIRGGYHNLLAMALRAPRGVRDRLPLRGRRVLRAGAVPRAQLLPRGRCRQHPDACPHPGRHPRRGDRQPARRRAEGDPQADSAGEIETLTDNIGMPISGINMTYNNTGVIGPQDGDIQIKLKEGHKPTEEHVRLLREQLPRLFPGVSFAFLPADIVSQILNFGAPAPIDLQIRGANIAGQLCLRQQSAGQGPRHSRRRRRAHPAVAEQPDLQHRCRPHPRAICRPDRARRHQQPRRQPRRLLAGRADLLSQSGERRVLLHRDADAAIPDRLAQRAADAADHGAGSLAVADPRRHRRHQALDVERGGVAIRHPAPGQIFATTSGRDLGAVADDIDR